MLLSGKTQKYISKDIVSHNTPSVQDSSGIVTSKSAVHPKIASPSRTEWHNVGISERQHLIVPK